MKTLWLKLRDSKLFWACVAGLALLCIGYAVGRNHKVPVKVEQRLVEDTASKQKLQEATRTIESLQQQLTIAQNQVSELKSHVKTVVRIVKQKDGTVTVDRLTESQTDKKTSESTNTSQSTNETKLAAQDKKVESESKTHRETVTTLTPVLKDTLYLGISSQLSLTGFSNPGLELKYRLIALGMISGWVGTEVVLPLPAFKLENIQFRFSLGMSF